MVRKTVLSNIWPLAVHFDIEPLLSSVITYSQFTWWRHQMETFSALLTLCAGNSPVPLNSHHKGQWRGALMFSLVWINGWVNNRDEAGDLRRYRLHPQLASLRCLGPIEIVWNGLPLPNIILRHVLGRCLYSRLLSNILLTYNPLFTHSFNNGDKC